MKSKLFNTTTATLLVAAFILAACGNDVHEEEPVNPVASSSPAPAETYAPVSTPIPTPSPIPVVAESGTYFDRYTNPESGQYVDYCVMIPENCFEGMPVILFLHGDGLTNRIDWLPEWGIAKRAKEIFNDNFPFILLIPCNRFPEWYEDGMGETLKGLLDSIVSDYSADTGRLIITGHSRGAIATWQMANEFKDYFSCAVPCSCGAAHIHGENFESVPVMAFCGGGENDQRDYYRDMKTIVDDINNKGGSATMTVLWEYDHPDMDYAPYTEEVFKWMISQ